MGDSDQVVVLDVDGTPIDGGILFAPSGYACGWSHVRGRLDISSILREMQIGSIVTARQRCSASATRRAELKILARHLSVVSKWERPRSLLVAERLGCQDVAYVGAESNELVCMITGRPYVGIPGCPAAATAEVKGVGHHVGTRSGDRVLYARSLGAHGQESRRSKGAS